jgi:hypothetical protein
MKKLIIVDVPEGFNENDNYIVCQVAYKNSNVLFASHIIGKEIPIPTDPEIVTILLTELEAVSQKEIQAACIILNHLTK